MKNIFFNFKIKTEVYAGLNIHKEYKKILSQFNLSRILILIDNNLLSNKILNKFILNIKKLGKVKVVNGPDKEPDFDYLDKLKKQSKPFKPTLILGIGGGSVMDSAKGLAIVLKNHGPSYKYQGLNLFKNKGLPCITIPTIFGSGASVTPSAVFINNKNNKKGGINGRLVSPTIAIIDPIFQQNLKINLIINSLCDSLVHSIESSVSNNSNLLTRNLAFSGVKILFEILDKLKNNKNKLQNLETLSLAEFYSILSLMHSEQGLAGALSYPLGVYHNVPHGIAGGRTLPYAIIYADKFNTGIWNDLAAFVFNWSSKNKIGSAKYLSNKIINYLSYYKVPSLINWISESDISNLAQETINFKGVMSQTKHKYKKNEVINFLKFLINQEKKYL